MRTPSSRQAGDDFAPMARLILARLREGGERSSLTLRLGGESYEVPRAIAEKMLEPLAVPEASGEQAEAKGLVSLEAAARFLNVPEDYALGLVETGVLPRETLGGKPATSRAALESYDKRVCAEASRALDFISQEARDMGLYV
jgi:hypothetical protein